MSMLSQKEILKKFFDSNPNVDPSKVGKTLRAAGLSPVNEAPEEAVTTPEKPRPATKAEAKAACRKAAAAVKAAQIKLINLKAEKEKAEEAIAAVAPLEARLEDLKRRRKEDEGEVFRTNMPHLKGKAATVHNVRLTPDQLERSRRREDEFSQVERELKNAKIVVQAAEAALDTIVDDIAQGGEELAAARDAYHSAVRAFLEIRGRETVDAVRTLAIKLDIEACRVLAVGRMLKRHGGETHNEHFTGEKIRKALRQLPNEVVPPQREEIVKGPGVLTELENEVAGFAT